ncbi:drug/metabolite transporter superfamily protein YnfA [Agrococcus sp. UYP10]|uniref:DUF2188 domain-containing protein n=1 Tax=Agrococcus sp. UYP10 TaxID=1756355 RepID=UPI003398821A
MTNNVLHVRPDAGQWVIHVAEQPIPVSRHGTQASAVEAARGLLLSRGGGQLHVHELSGSARRLDVGDPNAALSPADAWAAADAAIARVRGEDADSDGDAAMSRALLLGPDTASRRVARSANLWFDVVAIAAGLLAPVVGVSLLTPGLEGGVLAVFLSTLAISLGVFLAFVILARTQGTVKGNYGGVYAIVVIAVALVVSNGVADAVGQSTTLTDDPAAYADLERLMSSGPWYARVAAGAGFIIWTALVGGAFVYGAVGLVLAIGSGVLVGWRAHDLTKSFA